MSFTGGEEDLVSRFFFVENPIFFFPVSRSIWLDFLISQTKTFSPVLCSSVFAEYGAEEMRWCAEQREKALSCLDQTVLFFFSSSFFGYFCAVREGVFFRE